MWIGYAALAIGIALFALGFAIANGNEYSGLATVTVMAGAAIMAIGAGMVG